LASFSRESIAARRHAGESSRASVAKVEACAAKAKLTWRELSVLRLLANGDTYQRIADQLDIGYETVKTYVDRLRVKTGIRNRTAMSVWAIQNNLLGDK
jgi:DNA-binding NarL/FixJ family response regulator